MIKINFDGNILPEEIKIQLDKVEKKLKKRFPHLKLQINLRLKSAQQYFFPSKHTHPDFSSAATKTPTIAQYQGSFWIPLPQQAISVYFKGRNLREAIQNGISFLEKRLQKYKQKHFKSDSHYPDHSSIRKGSNHAY